MESGNGIDLVIFDCDGVLVDSERIALQVNVEVLARYGYIANEAQLVDAFVGKSSAAVKTIAAQWLGAERAQQWMDECQKLYHGTLANEVEPVDGIVEALDQITAQTCVASSGSHQKMAMTLGRTGLWERFQGRIFSVSEVQNGKPAPDLFLHAARSMGVDPSRCAVVEDSAPGVQAARAAGMACFAYAGGVTPADRLDGHGATLFKDMRELPALIHPNRAP